MGVAACLHSNDTCFAYAPPAACSGRGAVVHVTASNDNVLVATSRGYLLRYSWDEYGNERVSEVEVVPSKQQQDLRITAVYADPWANHVLLALRSGAGGSAAAAAGGSGHVEVYYVHRRWTRARPLAKLKGIGLTTVAWCCSQVRGWVLRGGAGGRHVAALQG